MTVAIEPAYERVKQMLFRPFNLGKWIGIGFCAWLAGLGEAGGGGGGFNGFPGFNGNYNYNTHHNNGQTLADFRHFYFQAKDYVLENIGWIVPVAAILVVLATGLWLLLLWLNCRGKFMFLHCVAREVAEVEVPWAKFARPANSLFRFRVVVGLAGLVLLLPLLVFMAVLILQMVLAQEVSFARVLPVVGLGAGFFVLSLAFALVRKFLVDFVVPIMFLRGGSCLSVWGEFFGLLTANFWKFVLYVLFQLVLSTAIGMVVAMVVLLPVLVFKRAYPAYYLAQYGERFDVFAAGRG